MGTIPSLKLFVNPFRPRRSFGFAAAFPADTGTKCVLIWPQPDFRLLVTPCMEAAQVSLQLYAVSLAFPDPENPQQNIRVVLPLPDRMNP